MRSVAGRGRRIGRLVDVMLKGRGVRAAGAVTGAAWRRWAVGFAGRVAEDVAAMKKLCD